MYHNQTKIKNNFIKKWPLFFMAVLALVFIFAGTALGQGNDRPAPAAPAFEADEGMQSDDGASDLGLTDSISIQSLSDPFQAGGDRLTNLQNNDGGWDWPLDDGDPTNNSPLNTVGPIAMGLAQAYEYTNDASHLAALQQAGVFLLAKTNNFSPSDGYLAAQLDLVFGGTTYTNHVKTNFYDPLAAGTYDRNGAGTLYDTAGYVNLIRTSRATQGIANLAAWDIGMGLVGAASAGADTSDWVAGVKAEIDELDGSAYYDVIGLAGAVYSLAFVDEDYDPTAGEHASASSLADLAAILAGYQISAGGFTWNSAYVSAGNETVQETSYAILALGEFDVATYYSQIQGATYYLRSVQLAIGGWENYLGSGENNEVTGEALWAISVLQCTTDCYVDDATGDNANGGTSWTDAKKTIQAAVDQVEPGGTVNVAVGMYVEQVEIPKNLTLKGAGSGTVVQSPDTLTKYFTTSNNNYPIIYVHDVDNVTIQDLVVDGAGKGNSNYRFYGIAYYNAGGTVDSVEITDVRDTPFSGAQHGVALYAYNADGTHRSLTISNCNVHDFQKNAMALNASPTTSFAVDVQDNQVTGYGPTTVTAQNGIQVYADQGTGTVAGNTVTGIAYSGSGWVASTILNYYADLNIIGNTTSNGHVGVYNIDGAGQINGNNITIIKAGGYAYGIIATDPPEAVPAPFDAEVLESTGVNSLSVINAASIQNVEVSNNTVMFSGPDNTATYGIEADAGYGDNDLAFVANHNLVSGFEMGIVAYKCESNCAPGVFTSIAATYNSLADNTIGMYSNVSDLEADGSCNWWGDDSGPSGVGLGSGSEVTDFINFAPWLVGGWPDGQCEEPTAISLMSFDTQVVDNRVMLMWETGTEIDNAGFNLYRSTSPDGPWIQINTRLIAAEGDSVNGASYSYLDIPGRGDYYYKLEDIDFFGLSTAHELVLAELGPAVRTPWFRPSSPN